MAIYLCRNQIIELWFIQFANISKLFEIWIIWNIDQLRYARDDLYEIVMMIYRYETASTIAERDNIKRIENLIKWKTPMNQQLPFVIFSRIARFFIFIS